MPPPPSPPKLPPPPKSSKMMAGGLAVFLVVGGAAAFTYKFFKSKMQKMEDLDKRIKSLNVEKGDFESLIGRFRRRVETLENQVDRLRGSKHENEGNDYDSYSEASSSIAAVPNLDDEISRQSNDGEGDDDEDDEITFIKPRKKTRQQQ